jgi:hypothetical protein
MQSLSKITCTVVLVCVLSIVLGDRTAFAQNKSGSVSLTQSQTTWKTLAYELDADHAIIKSSVDPEKVVERTFQTYVLENDYLKVTLLPEMGGRILSMIYKPTGHEELYQNPLGVPYGMGDGNFYYDWLIVYGGIFPTFPEPEHGKTWLLPWDFKVVSETAEAITVAMSIADDFAFKRAPGKFDTGVTGIKATYYITLEAGRAALDTRIVLQNASDKAVRYEYWTCTTLAPGSPPGDTRATAGAEIIAPIDVIKMPPWWPKTTAAEKSNGTQDVYSFNNLRLFKNWPDLGIAYAYPNLGGANFWGVINHDNEEGIIRIGNNEVTSGLKMWTWGFDSVKVDPFTQHTVESRPYIELWAGVTSEFFKHTTLASNAEVEIHETYSPTVGLTGVSQASRDMLAYFDVDASSSSAQLQVFSVQPDRKVRVIISANGNVIYDMPVSFDPAKASQISAPIPAGTSTLDYKIMGDDNTTLLKGELQVIVKSSG